MSKKGVPFRCSTPTTTGAINPSASSTVTKAQPTRQSLQRRVKVVTCLPSVFPPPPSRWFTSRQRPQRADGWVNFVKPSPFLPRSPLLVPMLINGPAVWAAAEDYRPRKRERTNGDQVDTSVRRDSPSNSTTTTTSSSSRSQPPPPKKSAGAASALPGVSD